MAKSIKFSLRIVNNENAPLTDQAVTCISENESPGESYTLSTNESGIVEFNFESTKKSVPVIIRLDKHEFQHEFHDGDGVTLKMSSDNLGIFLELVVEGIN